MKHTLTYPLTFMFAILSLAPTFGQDKAETDQKAESKTPAPAEERKASREKKKIVIYIPVEGMLSESSSELAMLFGGGEGRTLRRLVNRLDKAAEDENVVAVAISIGSPVYGWAQLQELRATIGRLRKADKKVYTFLRDATPGKYLLACAGSHVTMAPTGDVLFLGVHAEQMYFKGLLDWLGLEADMTHMGAYKGAAEPFTRTEPSPEQKEQTTRLMGDLYEQMVSMAAESRSLSPAEVKAYMDSGDFSTRGALKAKLIDALGYRGDFLDRIREEYGKDVKIVRNYGLKQGPDLDFSNPFTAIKSLSRLFQITPASKKTSIAVIYADGPIVMGAGSETFFGTRIVGSATLRKALDEARKDESVKAVVLRVDSPGGSALASDIIWHATDRLAAEKPFVVSMGNTAASGGYYVACQAESIFAEPATITGSIGVVGGKLITVGMWNKIGLTFHETKFGKYSDIMNTNRRYSDEERAIIVSWMGDIYDIFKERVVAGRGDRLKGKIEDLAGGRVYTGKQALAKGLIDKLGGLDDAIAHAADLAGLDTYQIRILPKPRGLMDILMEGMGGSDNEEVRLGLRHVRDFLHGGQLEGILGNLRQVDPRRTAALVRGLVQLFNLRSETVLTAMPSEILIR